MTNRRWMVAALGILLGLAVSSGAWAQAVLQSVTVRVHPGQMDTYREKVAALQDMNSREYVVLGTLAAAVLLLGLWPAPLVEVMDASVINLLQHISVSKL